MSFARKIFVENLATFHVFLYILLSIYAINTWWTVNGAAFRSVHNVWQHHALNSTNYLYILHDPMTLCTMKQHH
jgi:hypothetical protein